MIWSMFQTHMNIIKVSLYLVSYNVVDIKEKTIAKK